MWRMLFPLVSLVLIEPPLAQAAEIKGFDKVRFGMSHAQTKSAMSEYELLSSKALKGADRKFDHVMNYAGHVSDRASNVRIFFARGKVSEVNVSVKAEDILSEGECLRLFDAVFGQMKGRYGRPDAEPRTAREETSNTVGSVLGVNKRARFTSANGSHASLWASVTATDMPSRKSFSCMVIAAYRPGAKGPSF